jgi:pimeloyl-ACP methyl ester carboxylesterase
VKTKCRSFDPSFDTCRRFTTPPWKHRVAASAGDVVIIEGVGHYPMLEKPVEFNEKLRDVLKEFGH